MYLYSRGPVTVESDILDPGFGQLGGGGRLQCLKEPDLGTSAKPDAGCVESHVVDRNRIGDNRRQMVGRR